MNIKTIEKTPSITDVAKLLNVDVETSHVNNWTKEKHDEIMVQRILDQLQKIPYIPFPVSFHTVDMAPYKYNSEGEIEILLGRKPFREVFQFLGGFLDPKGTSEEAACRELREETSNTIDVKENELVYLKSYFIDDYRYKNSCHKVSTSFFCVEVSNDIVAKPGDDIEEVRWFKLNDLVMDKSLLLLQHFNLFNILFNHLLK